jgi:hypothetical protein
MNNGPPKYVKINGVTKLNPEYKRWKEAFGSASPEEGNKVSKVQINLYASRLVRMSCCCCVQWRLSWSRMLTESQLTFLDFALCHAQRKMWLAWAKELQILLRW